MFMSMEEEWVRSGQWHNRERSYRIPFNQLHGPRRMHRKSGRWTAR